MDAPRPETIYLKDYRAPEFRIENVDLDVHLEPSAARVTARLGVRPSQGCTSRRLVLDGNDLTLEGLKLDGKRLSAPDYVATPDALTIDGVPDRGFELEITTVLDPEANTALSGLYRTRGIYCTQCEPQGFRRITYFLDRPDVLSIYKTRIEAAKDEVPVLLANGNPVAAGDVAGTNRHFAVWHDPHPKPSYLFALVGGDLALVADRFTTCSGREVELRIYVEPGKEDRCAWAMDSLKRAMRWDEERFGLEYDLDIFMIVAVSDFNMGAMENKGLNIFNDKLILARPDTATDSEYAAIEAVIAHEYFHNWTGNRVTCRDWFQLCLKEGLTVFRDQEFTADMRSASVERIGDVRMLKTHQFPEDAGPLAHPVRPDSYIEINNFYTATVYEKGAELCRMLQTLLGRDGFREGLDLYFARHDGEAATVEDFVAAMADATETDLSHFMAWYSQAGTPEIACSLTYDAGARTAELAVNQLTPATPGQARKEALPIPIRLGLLGPNGDEFELKPDNGDTRGDNVFVVEDREQHFKFRDIPSRPVPSLLRGFSAPVKLTTHLATGDLEFLMAHDSDLFNRWQAGNDYAMRIVMSDLRPAEDADRPEALPFARALGASLADASLAPAFRAEQIRLPSESDIARELARDVDTDAIHDARQALSRTIAGELHASLIAIYESCADDSPYSPDAESTGRRALRNAALGLLASLDDAEARDRLVAHYRQAGNMTDKMAALINLTHIDDPRREEVFDEFFDDWKHDHLVVDKWFMLQAISTRSDALDRVRELTEHPLYSPKVPNKVRALIGAFAHGNPVGFNRADGAGYRFVAETALELDRVNPQIAARLLGCFNSWRTLEKGRRDRARAALEQVAGTGGLSRDIYEIVTKTLE